MNLTPEIQDQLWMKETLGNLQNVSVSLVSNPVETPCAMGLRARPNDPNERRIREERGRGREATLDAARASLRVRERRSLGTVTCALCG